MTQYKFKSGDEINIVVKNNVKIIDDDNRISPAVEFKPQGGIDSFSPYRKPLKRRIQAEDLIKFYDLSYYLDANNIGHSVNFTPVLKPGYFNSEYANFYTEADNLALIQSVDTSLNSRPISITSLLSSFSNDYQNGYFPMEMSVRNDAGNTYTLLEALNGDNSHFKSGGLAYAGQINRIFGKDAFSGFFDVDFGKGYFTNQPHANSPHVNLEFEGKEQIYLMPRLRISLITLSDQLSDLSSFQLKSGLFSIDAVRLYDKSNPNFRTPEVIDVAQLNPSNNDLIVYNQTREVTSAKINTQDTYHIENVNNQPVVTDSTYSNLIANTNNTYRGAIASWISVMDSVNGVPSNAPVLQIIVKQNNQTFYFYQNVQ